MVANKANQNQIQALGRIAFPPVRNAYRPTQNQTHQATEKNPQKHKKGPESVYSQASHFLQSQLLEREDPTWSIWLSRWCVTLSHAVSLTCTMKADGEPARMLLDVMQKCRQRLRFKTLVEYCRAAAFSRCGNVFFPLQQLFGLQSWAFSAASFFPASAGFFLASDPDKFFPASDGFSPLPPECFFLLQRCFFAAARCFFCCFEFFPLRSGIFCWHFPRCKNSFFPLQGVFFLLPSTWN